MTAFWVIGIGINLVFAGALVWWAVRSWRDGRDEASRDGRDDHR